MNINIVDILIALCAMAIVYILFRVAMGFIEPKDSKLATLLWAVCAIICIAILIGALTGHTLISFS